MALHLGHINLNKIHRLIKSRISQLLILEDLLVCESYIEDKMAKRPFTAKGYRAKECLKLVHIDVCGSFNVHAWEGYKYFITFTNDYSNLGYIYMMHRKSNAFDDEFIEFKVNISRHFDLI